MNNNPVHIQMTMDQLLTTAVNKVPHSVMESWLNKVHCGDCIELMGKMPAGSIDLIVTSPPYNLRNSTGNGMKDAHDIVQGFPVRQIIIWKRAGGINRGGKWRNAQLVNGYDDHDDDMPHEEYVEWQRNCLTAMMRVLREDGAIFYNHKWRVQGGVMQDRFNPGYFLPTYEVIYLICKPDFKLAPKANAVGDVWIIPQENNNPHPAPFPVELAQRCIQSTTAGIILDPFMGSGTTAIAAEVCGREWIGLELSKRWCVEPSR